MKRFILIIFALLLSVILLGQEDYPRIETDSTGQVIVLLTLEQAQKLDNSTDLLILLERLDTEVTEGDIILLRIISEKDQIIQIQEVQIKKLEEFADNKDSVISNLNGLILIKDGIIQNKEKDNKIVEEQLKESKEEIKDLKTKMFFGGTIGSAAITALLFLLIL